MKMVGAAGLLALCPLAAYAQAPSELILGQWTCSANTPDGLVSSQMNYNSGGTTSSVLILTSGAGESRIEAILRLQSTWRIPGDGTLRERATEVEVVRFTFGGEPLDESAKDVLIEDLTSDEAMSSSLKITADSMSMIDNDGTRTLCMR